MFGWTGNLLRVNLTDKTIKKSPMPKDAECTWGQGACHKIINGRGGPEGTPFRGKQAGIHDRAADGTFAAAAAGMKCGQGTASGTIGASNSGRPFRAGLKYAGYDG